MRYESNGTVLWYGTPDAPAAEGDISASSSGRLTGLRCTFAVKPAGARNAVELRYRLNGGAIGKIRGSLARSDVRTNTQYFVVSLPELKVSDRLDYIAVAKLTKGQVPAESEASQFPSSLKVVAADSKSDPKATHSNTGTAAKQSESHDQRAATSPATAGGATHAKGDLTKAQLLALAKNAKLTLPEMTKADQGLGVLLADRISAERKATCLDEMRGCSAELKTLLNKIDFSPLPASGSTLGKAILAGLTAQKANEAIMGEAQRKIRTLEGVGRLADVADLETPIKDHPLFQEDLLKASLYQLVDAARLSDAKGERLVSLADSPALVDDEMLTALVADKTLTAAEANSLGVVLTLSFLSGGNAELAVEMSPKIRAFADLVKLSAADWQRGIEHSKAEPPDGLDAVSYAAALRRAATNLFPTDALADGHTPAEMKDLEAALTLLAPLAGKNDKIYDKDFEELDLSAVHDSEVPAAKDAHRRLQEFANRHPGLGLAHVLNGRDTPAAKIATLLKRIEVLEKLRAQNSDAEFMGLDYTEGSADREALKVEGISDADLHMAIANLKATQRIHALTKDVDHTKAILAGGYSSGSAIALDDAEEFTRRSGLDEATARSYHKKAESALSRASHGVVSAIDAYDGPFHRMPVGNVRQGIKDHLKAIPGFSDLFGGQAYCKCTECQSILGAPAYFVDLMTFVEENLTGRVFRGKKAKNPLNLKVRRPDLWTLPLTCDNTNTLVAYLDIINPTLENYIVREYRDYKGPLSDRTRIETAVYEETLAKAHNSFQQPFTLPLEEIDTYLEHFTVTRLQIVRAMGADQPVIVKAALKISDGLYGQLNDASADQGFLKEVYGIEFGFSGTVAHVGAMNVELLLQSTGYSRSDFEAAATSRFVTKNQTYKIQIRSEKRSPESIQNDIEKIHGLTADALHRLYRFTRLLRSMPWSIPELDLILTQLDATGSVVGADEQVLFRFVQMLDLRKRWSVSVDQLCSLWSPIPTTPTGNNLFDRLFNFAPLVQTDGTLPKLEMSFVHSAFSNTGTALFVTTSTTAAAPTHEQHAINERLLAGLQVSDTDLVNLITNLAGAIGANINNANVNQRGFILSLANFTLLYRHALLARLLNLRILDLFQLIQLAGIASTFVSSIDELMEVLTFYDWYQGSGYQLDDLGMITRGQVQAPASYPNPTALAGTMAATVAANHSLEFSDRVFILLLGVTEAESQQMIAGNPALFAPVPGVGTPTFWLTPAMIPGTPLQFDDTVFAFLPGVSVSQSQQVIAANPTIFVQAGGSGPPALQLSSTFNPQTTIAIPDGVPLDPTAAMNALIRYSGGTGGANSAMLNYHPLEIIPSSLTGLLGIEADVLACLLTMTGADLTSPGVFLALQAGGAAPATALAPLIKIISNAIPLKVLFGAGVWGASDLSFIQQNAALFGISNFNVLTMANVRKLSVYNSFAANRIAAGLADMTPLQDVLTSFTSAAQFNQSPPTELASVLGIEQKQLSSLLPNVTLPATAAEALVTLSSIATMAKTLGLGGEALKRMPSDAYVDQAMSSDALLGAFRAQYHEERQFTDRFRPFDDRIRQRKRDALADFLLTVKGHQFSVLDDLYNYFLLDVQLEGCMLTSWVVAAISSVQLYVYRCIMNLEQDARPANDPEHIDVRLSAEAVEEWEWRQNFRVWQANREVFLLPEKYLLPELRDDMTPLYEDFQSNLLQQPITEQNVLDAYGAYMSGFDQLSKLKIAGSYHDIDKRLATDVLHLFGVSPADPPTFFYRTVENAIHGETESDRAVTYTPWVPVNLQIHCREVSPVVYLGRLLVFWSQTTTAPLNVVVNSNSIFAGYKHTWTVKYSSLRLDQTWTPPQQLALTDSTTFPMGDGVVMDPLLDYMDKGYDGSRGTPPGYDVSRGFDATDGETTQILLGLANSNNQSQSQQNCISAFNNWSGNHYPNNSFTSTLSDYQQILTPLYGSQIQTASVDSYTLSGFQWDRVYPTADPDSQELLMSGRNFCVRAQKVDFYYQTMAPIKRKTRRSAGQTVFCSKQDPSGSSTHLYVGIQDSFPKLERYPWCSIVSKETAIQKLGETAETAGELNNDFGLGGSQPLIRGLYRKTIAAIPRDANIDMINSSATDAITDAIIDCNGDVLHLQRSARPDRYVMKRLTTTLGENLCRALFANGVDGLLSLDTQLNLGESKPRVKVDDHIQDEVVVGEMDFTGAMGTYFREVFFYGPWLIADQLNSQQNYSAALQWYRYIFDPTANDDELLDVRERAERDHLTKELERDDAKRSIHHEMDERVGVRDRKGSKEEERKRALAEIRDLVAKKEDRKKIEERIKQLAAKDRAEDARDRVWRFVEFRNLDVPTLRQVLTDAAAIDAYEQDPFNPHAIARLRLSAYQKCMVMNYLDILIEWGDVLFTEFQMETVNEATLLYVQAREIHGQPAEEIGNCGDGNECERTYEAIAPLIKKGSEFLVEMETYTHCGTGAARAQHKSRLKQQYMIDYPIAHHYFENAVASCRAQKADTEDKEKRTKPTSEHSHVGAVTAAAHHAPKVNAERGAAHPFHWKGPERSTDRLSKREGRDFSSRAGKRTRKPSANTAGKHGHRHAASVARQIMPAFCVPPSDDLAAYWELIEDRLYKIRHGMDINGVHRQLSLFAPPIDPMLLVEGTAAGLSLEDVLESTSGDVPPYRFTYLIEKARQYAAQTQSFGGAVLSAIEKRDAQTLEVLRVTQQQNILGMTTAIKTADVEAAQNAVDTLNAQLDTAQFRHDYFEELIQGGLNAWEIEELEARSVAAGVYIVSAVLNVLSGVLGLIPQIGSPFSMNYGGDQTSKSSSGFGQGTRDIATVAETVAALTGLLGGHDRRSDGWQHEVDMATKDVTVITTQLVGAKARLLSANKALEIHNKTIAQNQQVADFYTSRFSSIALYTWLATTLKSTHRKGYTSTYGIAKLAEQAYRFERNDQTTILLSDPYWIQSKSGLLAGEMLLADLQNMERRFIETNYRTPEITQSFSMMQVAPAALLNLRQNASCSFDIPELCFDLFYPGQYCRKIKAVRLTIPCVTGPLTNVGATLTLTASKLRLKPKAGDGNLTPMQLKNNVLIATSTAQNDTGIFEFSFRDERYMPFEGAGAISTWKIDLPDGFRQFDYQTISDVILHVSYTAEQDDKYRQVVEQKNGTIAAALKSIPLGRLFSLRQEFPTALNRLLHSGPSTPVTLSISTMYLPYFVGSSPIQVTQAALLLRTAPSQRVDNFAITIDGTRVTGFSMDPTMGNLWLSDVSGVFSAGLFGKHAVTVTNAGELAPPASQTGVVQAAVDDSKLLDVMLYVQYQLAAS